jgi:hypothetical protein
MGQAEKDIKRPSAKEHTEQYGMIYGFLLAMLYLFLGDTLFRFNNSIPIFERLIAYGFIAVFCGAVLGIVMGGFIGGNVDFYLRSQSFPMDERTFQRTGRIVQILTASSCLLVMVLLMGFYLFLALRHPTSFRGFFWFSLPMGVSTIAAMYSTHRYMQKLKVLGFVHERKSKAKHEMSHQMAGDVAADDNIVIDATEVQQESLS